MMQEYQNKFEQLNQNIEPSDELILQTRQRMAAAKPQKWLPRMKKTVAVAACTMLIFTGAVNVSPAFASAAAKVPLVRELVLAVALDPSMKTAIEHNYVQLVKQSASDNGYQIDVEYLVTDPANLTVYYEISEIADMEVSTELNRYDEYHFVVELLDMNGKKLKASGYWTNPINDIEQGELSTAKFHFYPELGRTLPEKLQLQLTVEKALPLSEEEQKKVEAAQGGHLINDLDSVIASYEIPRPEYEEVARMCLPLHIDKNSLFNVRTLNIDQTVDLDGQKVIFDKVEIYPTQVRVFWHPHEANTHYIDNMKIALQSQEHGNWEGISNGVSSVGGMGEAAQVWLESSWFGDGTEYQLAIESYSLIPKEKEAATYDYSTNTVTNWPSYAQLVEVQPCDTGLFMELMFRSNDEIIHGNVLNNEAITSCGSSHSYDRRYQTDEENGIYWFYNQFIVEGDSYKTEPIVFDVTWAPPQVPEEPIIVPLNADGAE